MFAVGMTVCSTANCVFALRASKVSLNGARSFLGAEAPVPALNCGTRAMAAEVCFVVLDRMAAVWRPLLPRMTATNPTVHSFAAEQRYGLRLPRCRRWVAVSLLIVGVERIEGTDGFMGIEGGLKMVEATEKCY